MKIETCPVCGNPIEYMELTTLPPVPVKQCPSCGWRWEGKPEKIEYAPIEEETTMMIEDLEKALQYFVIAVPESEEQAKAYFWARKAIIGLRSMQEAREYHFRDATKMVPLTLGQLREMCGLPVFVIAKDEGRFWAFVNSNSVYADNRRVLFFDDPYTKYGDVWFAYPYPPAHIDRSKWEACELCSLPDGKSASRLILAETCNGEAKYCPSCGRPLTEEAWAELERRLRK